MTKIWSIALFIAACGRQQGEPPKQEHARLEGEIAMTLGDCAPPTTRFISGPEPQAFGELKPATSLYATMSPSGDIAAGFDAPNEATGSGAPSAADKLAAGDIIASAHYIPGASSPLIELRLALLDCFREQDRRLGVAVFDLALGAITSHGIANAHFTKCIATLAPQIKVKQPMRCSVAFGAAQLPELPHIDAGPDAVKVNGSPVAFNESTDEWWKLEPIFTWSSDRVKTTLASTAPVTLHGPVIVRPQPATQMKLVTKLVHSLLAAGEDPMLAADRNGTWQLLHPRALPVVPVPLGTGGSWNNSKAKLKVDRTSILVGKKQLWIDGKVATDDALAAQQGAVELAAEGEVPYSRVVEVIDKLTNAEWSLTSGRALAKRPAPTHIDRTTRQDVRGPPISK